MSHEQWSGALVAIIAADRYFEGLEVRDCAGGREVYRAGDCVRLATDEVGLITALWETATGDRCIEVRHLYELTALPSPLQAPAAAFAASGERVGRLWESNRLETIDTVAIIERVRIADVHDPIDVDRSDQRPEFVVVGIYDTQRECIEPLPKKTTRQERSVLVSARARRIHADDASGNHREVEDPKSSSPVDRKRRRLASEPIKVSPEAQAIIDKMHAACQELLLSHAPDRTTAREDERDLIHEQLHMAIGGAAYNGALYISGLPGTGKTSIVREVIRELELEREHGLLPRFVSTEINGLHLPKPEVAYASIWKAMTGSDEVPRSLGPAKLCQMLAQEFERGNPNERPVILVVLDEMDFLVTGKSVVLYNILEWQTYSKAKLVVVGIANTMDLPERLEQKVRSRLGTNRLIFSSYTSSQLERIVRQRLGKLDVFGHDAIQLCCKFVAQASGDARQALTLCRRAAEVAIQRLSSVSSSASSFSTPHKVTAEDLQVAQTATSVSAPLVRLRDCRKFECVFLIALRMEVRKSDKDDAAFESVLHRFAILCTTHSLTPVPRLRDLLLICAELQRSGIIRQVHSKTARYPKLSLRCSPQEIYDVFLSHPVGRQLLA